MKKCLMKDVKNEIKERKEVKEKEIGSECKGKGRQEGKKAGDKGRKKEECLLVLENGG